MRELWAARCHECSSWLARHEIEIRARSAMSAHPHRQCELIRESDLIPRESKVPAYTRPVVESDTKGT